MGAFDIGPEIRDLHHRAGWSATAYNDAGNTESGDWVDRSSDTNDYDDGTAITIRIEWGPEAQESRGASGREITGDAVIVVDPDEATFTAGDEETQATEIVDQDSKKRYRVLRVMDQQTGVLRLDCKRQT